MLKVYPGTPFKTLKAKLLLTTTAVLVGLMDSGGLTVMVASAVFPTESVTPYCISYASLKVNSRSVHPSFSVYGAIGVVGKDAESGVDPMEAVAMGAYGIDVDVYIA